MARRIAASPSSAHAPRRVDGSRQLLRGDSPIGVGAHGGDFVPIDPAVQSNTDPSPAAYVRRPEESVRLGVDQLVLGSGWRGTPQVREVMIVVAIRPQHDELLPD